MDQYYIDCLIENLRKSNRGCYIGHRFVGCIIYADDIVLLCPSVIGLQDMVNICSEFSREYDILFNETKSLCMQFGNDEIVADIVLNNKPLNWCEKVKHVGNMINSALTDEDDILIKKQDFFHQVNKLIVDYKGLRYNVIKELFRKYCTSFYGCQCWDLRSKCINDFYIAFNKGARRVLDLPYSTHRYQLPIILGMDTTEVILCKRFLKLSMTMFLSKNSMVSFLFQFFSE